MTTDVRSQRPRAGVLAAQHLEELIAAGRLAGDPAVQPAQVQPASVDLRLGAVGYRVQASARRCASGWRSCACTSST
jgi:hypothetical protein